MSSTWKLLSGNRDFRRFVVASVVSLLGDWFAFVAVSDLVGELTGRPGAAAFVYAATVLPAFFATPAAGAVADRFDRQRILVIVDLVRVPIALLLCVAAAWRNAALAVGVVGALTVGSSFFDPVATAATPNLVDPEDLLTAQALMSTLWGALLFVGSGLGGIVAELWGAQVAFAANAASFLASALIVAGIRTPMQQALPARGVKTPLSEAVRFIRGTRYVRDLVLAKGGVSSANGTVGLLPAFGAATGASMATGVLFAARGFGALIGPIIVGLAIGRRPSRAAVVRVCGVATLVYAACYAVFPFVSTFALLLVLVVVAHFCGGAQWTVSTFALQVTTPDHVRGRVLAIDYGIATCLIGASSLLAAFLAPVVGVGSAMLALAGVGAAFGAVWLPTALRSLR